MKKIVSFILLLSVILVPLTGCSIKEENKDIEIAIITDDKEYNYNEYEYAKYITNIYKQNNQSDIVNDEVKHIIMPKDFGENKNNSEKFINKIINDKDLDGVVFASSKPNIVNYINKIKLERKDMIVVGSNLNANEKELADNLDISFISNEYLSGKNTVQLAKEMGSEVFILYYSEKDLKEDSRLKNKIEEIEEECKIQDIKFEKIKVKDINSKEDEYDVKKFISESINNQIYKYGEDINLFGTNKTMDDVILKRAVKSKLIVSEVSDGCMVEGMKDFYKIIRKTIYMGDYKGYSRSISDKSAKYEMNGRLGGIIMPNEIFTVYAAVDTAIAIAEDGGDVKKAYNSYFIEKNIYEKEGITASFESINNKYPSIKVVSVDQIIY